MPSSFQRGSGWYAGHTYAATSYFAAQAQSGNDNSNALVLLISDI